MMKRIICIMLVSVMVCLCTGCNQSGSKSAEKVHFYYMQNQITVGAESPVIAPYTVNVDRNSINYRSLLETYLNGPTNYDCVSPFPAGIYLEDFQMDNNKVQLVLSPHMATLSDGAFTIACACLTRTVIEMTGVKALYIMIQGKQINGVDSLMLTLEDFTYLDSVKPGDNH